MDLWQENFVIHLCGCAHLLSSREFAKLSKLAKKKPNPKTWYKLLIIKLILRKWEYVNVICWKTEKKMGFYLAKGLVTFSCALHFALSLVCHVRIFASIWIVRATVQAGLYGSSVCVWHCEKNKMWLIHSFSGKMLKWNGSRFHLSPPSTKSSIYSQLGVNNIAICRRPMEREAEHEQGGNRTQNHHERYRGPFCLAAGQPGQAGRVMSQKLVILDAYVHFLLLCFI